MTETLAVTIGWAGFLLEIAALTWLFARHNR
jgi:hypothetical protein